LNITFGVKQQSQVKISLLNLLGQEIRVIRDGSFAGGNHTLTYQTSGLTSGIYFLKLESGEKTSVRKVVLSE
jgi:hypothetical protein